MLPIQFYRRLLLRGMLVMPTLRNKRLRLCSSLTVDRNRQPRAGDKLRFLSGPRIRELITAQDVRHGEPPIQAWPADGNTGIPLDGTRSNQFLLLRLDFGGPNSVIGFTSICTHAGCAVSVWKAAERHLFCPCHGSEYDPAQGGIVTSGPAPRPLPSLSIVEDNGLLKVASGFNEQIGGSTSRSD